MKLNQFIKIARKEKGFSLVSLASASGLTYSMLYRLEEGSLEKPHPDILKKLHAPLGANYKVLMNLAGYLPEHPIKQKSSTETQRIPVISWQYLQELQNILGDLSPEISKKWLTTPIKTPGTFAMEIPTHNFSPIFEKGETIIIEPKTQYKHNNFLILLNQNSTPTIKQLKIYHNTHVLISIDKTETPTETIISNTNILNILGKISTKIFN